MGMCQNINPPSTELGPFAKQDVNECLLRNGHGPCQDMCENRWGGYSCGCAGLPGTRLAADGHGCEDDGECAQEKNRGGCSHRCLSTLGRVFCLCPDGLRLGADWKTCEVVPLSTVERNASGHPRLGAAHWPVPVERV
uniref:EGF-like domain-containing protein n=1 Tax=Anopheles maculatus TaxID=74869 RepID=A0A182T5Y0_9DIPT